MAKTPPSQLLLPPDVGQRAIGGAANLPTVDGLERNTTALYNPMWDQWLTRLAAAEGQTPDAGGVTHLTLAGSPDAPHPVYDEIPNTPGERIGQYVTPALAGIRAHAKAGR